MRIRSRENCRDEVSTRVEEKVCSCDGQIPNEKAKRKTSSIDKITLGTQVSIKQRAACNCGEKNSVQEQVGQMRNRAIS